LPGALRRRENLRDAQASTPFHGPRR
jgi:hypothetical protein